MSVDRPPLTDQPGVDDITARIARFLLEVVVPALDDPSTKHRARVAGHLLEQVSRELVAGSAPGATADEDGRLCTEELVERFGSVARLTRDLEAGELSVLDPEVLGVLRAYTELKVGIAEIRRTHDQKEQTS